MGAIIFVSNSHGEHQEIPLENTGPDSSVTFTEHEGAFFLVHDMAGKLKAKDHVKARAPQAVSPTLPSSGTEPSHEGESQSAVRTPPTPAKKSTARRSRKSTAKAK